MLNENFYHNLALLRNVGLNHWHTPNGNIFLESINITEVQTRGVAGTAVGREIPYIPITYNYPYVPNPDNRQHPRLLLRPNPAGAALTQVRLFHFPYISGLNNPSGFVCIPKNIDAYVITDNMNGCSIRIFDNFDLIFRVYIHDGHCNGIQSLNPVSRQNTINQINQQLTNLTNIPHNLQPDMLLGRASFTINFNDYDDYAPGNHIDNIISTIYARNLIGRRRIYYRPIIFQLGNSIHCIHSFFFAYLTIYGNNIPELTHNDLYEFPEANSYIYLENTGVKNIYKYIYF